MYVFRDDSPKFILHSFIGYFRLAQLYIFSLLIPYKQYWDEKSQSFHVLNFVSTFFHGLPSKTRLLNAEKLLIVYCLIILSWFLHISISAAIFRSYGKLSHWNSSIISILMSSIMIIIHPMALQSAGELISAYFSKEGPDNISFWVYFSLLLFVFYCVFQHYFSFSFEFRPISLYILSQKLQTLFFVSINVVTLISSIGSKLSPNLQMLFILFSMVPASLILYCVFGSLTFITKDEKLNCFVVSTISLFNLSLGLISRYFLFQVSDVVFFGQIGLYIIIIIIGIRILKSIFVNHLLFLDAILENQEVIEDYWNIQYLLKCSVSGFIYGHPVCINWDIFQIMTKRWPNEINVWYLFGKFVSIFPQEYHLLTYICQSIMSNNIHGIMSKRIIEEAKLIQQRRESILTPILKQKLCHIQKMVQNAKRKLRYFWDQVIIGNNAEIDNGSKVAYQSISSIQIDFNHLLNEFPNNRFVVKYYLSFLHDILADNKSFHQWTEKLKILKRGISIVDDKAHLNGIHYFPFISTSNRILIQRDTMGKPEPIEFLDKDDIDSEVGTNEQDALLQDNICELSIPFFKVSIVLFVSVIIVYGAFSLFVCVIYYDAYQNESFCPIDFVYHVSYIRSIQFHLAAFGLRLVLEEYPPENPLFDHTDYDGKIPLSLGSTEDTREQIKYLMSIGIFNLQKIEEFRELPRDNPDYKIIQTLFFSPSISYMAFIDTNRVQTRIMSFIDIILDIITQSSRLIQIDAPNHSTINSTIILNPGVNCAIFSDVISNGLLILIEAMKTADISKKRVILLSEIIFCTSFTLFVFISTSYSINSIKNNKKKVHSALISLPKVNISQIIDELRLFRDDDTDSINSKTNESNQSKNEDTILKVFFQASDSSVRYLSHYNLIRITNIFITIVVIILALFIGNQFSIIDDQIIDNAPHVDSILGAAGYLIGNFAAMNCWVSSINGIPCGSLALTELATRSMKRIEKSKEFFMYSRFGGINSSKSPFPGFEEDISEFDKQYLSKYITGNISLKLREIYQGFSLSQQFLLVEACVHHIFKDFFAANITYFNARNEMYSEIWYMVCFSLYEDFFFKIFDRIIPNIQTVLKNSIDSSIYQLSLLFLLLIILTSFLFYFLDRERNIIKFCIAQVLHCPNRVILESPRVMELLSGDFENIQCEQITKDYQFFDHIVRILDYPIIVANSNQIITYVNPCFLGLFETQQDIIGKSFQEFFLVNFPESSSFIQNQEENINNSINVSIVLNQHIRIFIIEFNIIDKFKVYTFYEITKVKELEESYLVEKSRIEKYISIILPYPIFKSYLNYSRPVSFSVQYCTIGIINIVGFSSFVQDTSQETAVGTISSVFSIFEEQMKKHKTITFVKSYGDVYIVAGGVSPDYIPPSEHCLDMVLFGLQIIGLVQQYNIDNKTSLQIRIGIHTGGPINVGIVNTEIPSFDLVGQAFLVAQEIEQAAKPMTILTTQSVYEYVYSSKLNIIERGEMQTSFGKIFTYNINKTVY